MPAGRPTDYNMKRIMVKDGEEVYLIPADNISYFYSVEGANYTVVHLKTGKMVTVDESIKSIDRRLGD